MSSTPRERRHERTRQSILNAAVALIAEQGPDNLSLRGIARRIDYSPAGLYEYFDSKDEIVDAVCGEGNGHLVDYLRSVDTDLPLAEYLVELGLAYIRFAQDYPAHFTLIFGQLSSELEEPPKTTDSLHPEDAFTILYQAIQSGIDDGTITGTGDDAAMTISYTLWALVHGMAVLQATKLSDLVFNFAAADRFAVETLVRGLTQTRG
jgi:AcrR family transcriptional regulator